MAADFLSLYTRLRHIDTPLTGFWLCHGDDPLLMSWVTDIFITNWRQHHREVERQSLDKPTDWLSCLDTFNALSLFSEASATILSGKQKPNKAGLAQLEQFASQPSDNALLVMMPRQNSNAKKTKLFKLAQQNNPIIECHLYNERQRQTLLEQKATQDFGLMLTPEAWQLLLAYTQQNLLSAYQALWRLRDLSNEAALSHPVDVQALTPALVSQSQFSLYDLTDAALAGNASQVVKIIQQLKISAEPESLVLWALSREMRVVMRLVHGESMQSLNIWQSKQGLYCQAMQRHTPDTVADWSQRLYHCDAAIKGILKQPAWELLLQLALQLAGIQLFQTSTAMDLY